MRWMVRYKVDGQVGGGWSSGRWIVRYKVDGQV